MGSEIYSGTMCSQAEDEDSHSEKDLFVWGVLSCGRLMETGVCL